MIALSVLVFLPRSAVAAIALVLIAGHNLLDPIKAEAFGPAAPIWNFLHEPALLQFGATVRWFAVYPLIPWIGVMAAGYALGPVFTLDRAKRTRWLVGWGTVAVVGFVLLRASNRLRRPRALERSSRRNCDVAVLHQLRKISAIAAVSGHDDRADIAAACCG